MKEKANLIYNTYVVDGSIFEVNVDFFIKESLTDAIKEENITREMFDDAIEKIIGLMEHDSVPKFFESELYKSRLQGCICFCPL